MAENVLRGWDGDGDGKIDITEWESRRAQDVTLLCSLLVSDSAAPLCRMTEETREHISEMLGEYEKCREQAPDRYR